MKAASVTRAPSKKTKKIELVPLFVCLYQICTYLPCEAFMFSSFTRGKRGEGRRDGR